jgi:hypothetical protein
MTQSDPLLTFGRAQSGHSNSEKQTLKAGEQLQQARQVSNFTFRLS